MYFYFRNPAFVDRYVYIIIQVRTIFSPHYECTYGVLPNFEMKKIYIHTQVVKKKNVINNGLNRSNSTLVGGIMTRFIFRNGA